jgi:hypothetical protein
MMIAGDLVQASYPVKRAIRRIGGEAISPGRGRGQAASDRCLTSPAGGRRLLSRAAARRQVPAGLRRGPNPPPPTPSPPLITGNAVEPRAPPERGGGGSPLTLCASSQPGPQEGSRPRLGFDEWWSSASRILVKCRPSRPRLGFDEWWSSAGQILVKRWSDTGQTPVSRSLTPCRARRRA